MRFLVTAGNTRESIDRVRDWGNIFTGNTGLAIAGALSRLGPVDLLTSNRQHLQELQTARTPAPVIVPTAFTTHAELKRSLAERLAHNQYDAIFMTAAVSDYRPERVYSLVEREPDPHDPRLERWMVRDATAAKVKSSHERIAILGQRTEKLVDLFRLQWGYKGLLVKFKLEVGIAEDELLRIGQASRSASGADYLVANTLEMLAGDRPGAYLLWQGGQRWIARDQLPQTMAEIALANKPALPPGGPTI